MFQRVREQAKLKVELGDPESNCLNYKEHVQCHGYKKCLVHKFEVGGSKRKLSCMLRGKVCEVYVQNSEK